MIDTKHYTVIEQDGYTNKTEAYDKIRFCYSHIPGITTYYDDGKWFIVQMNCFK